MPHCLYGDKQASPQGYVALVVVLTGKDFHSVTSHNEGAAARKRTGFRHSVP